MSTHHKTRIIVGMSGGVDSSVAALLLKQQGHDVEGVFMQNWVADQDDPNCTASDDLSDAKSVAKQLDIPLHVVNFADRYWQNVFQHFLDEYTAGRTPNPDILCNKEIKFKAFLDYALNKGADFIATGHYVRKRDIDGQFQLLKGLDANKDQSYFLYTLGQHQLAKSLFPVGELEKPQVRDIAKQHGFINHNKKDSTGICFIGERKFKSFLNEYVLAKPGDIATDRGEIIGRHDGLMFYTLGQRQGIGLGGLKNSKEAPWYVVAKEFNHNRLIVGQDHQHHLLMSHELVCQQLDWVNNAFPNSATSLKAKIRYRQTDQDCEISRHDEKTLNVKFKQAQRAITPGQSVVFYHDDICLGGGVIETAPSWAF